jgi:hypothetical protein
MGYPEGEKKYADAFLRGICPALVDAGEFKDIETCMKEGSDEARTQSANWAKVASKRMALYLKG